RAARVARPHRGGNRGAAVRQRRRRRATGAAPAAGPGRPPGPLAAAVRTEPGRRVPAPDRSVAPGRRRSGLPGAGPPGRERGGGGMKDLTEIGLLFRRHLVQLLRSPVWLVVGFSTPILYLALFTPLLKNVVPGGHVLDEFLPGILALLVFAAGSS